MKSSFAWTWSWEDDNLELLGSTGRAGLRMTPHRGNQSQAMEQDQRWLKLSSGWAWGGLLNPLAMQACQLFVHVNMLVLLSLATPHPNTVLCNSFDHHGNSDVKPLATDGENTRLLMVFPELSSSPHRGKGRTRTSGRGESYGNEWPGPSTYTSAWIKPWN